MIFVTVGTHEQPFNRLVEYMDRWAGSHDEEVFIQTGYTKYAPKNCRYASFISRDEMVRYIRSARIVVTHGGPCCYTDVLKEGKIPVVVPRSKDFGEQIDDHQIEIGREYRRRYGNIVLVEDIGRLGDAIARYDELIKDRDVAAGISHNEAFCADFSRTVDQLFETEETTWRAKRIYP